MPTILKNPTNLENLTSTYLPGDVPCKKSVLILFEEPLFSFYCDVFPELKRLNHRALLGVSPRYILESTKVDSKTRKSVPYALSMQDGFFEEKAPFCTWLELKEMVLSGHVEVASHSFSKMNLTFSFVNLEREIIHSKRVLEEKLPQAISSFIFPFGKKNKRVEELVSRNYTYLF